MLSRLAYGWAVLLSDLLKAFSERNTEEIRTLFNPGTLERSVRGIVLHDPIDVLPNEPDSILILTGVRVNEQTATQALRAASLVGYSAVVVKVRGEDASQLILEAQTHNITLLAASDEITWQHLDVILHTILGSQGSLDQSATGLGNELYTLANSLASIIGGSVAIEDMDRRVLAYSSLPDQRIDALREQGILGRHVPDMERNLAQYRSVLAGQGVTRFPEVSDEFARAAIAVKAGARPLGTIWAIEKIGGITPEGERLLLEGARLAALHILRNQIHNKLELQVREETLRSALDASLSAKEIAYRLAIPAGTVLSLVGFAAIPDANGTAPLITHLGHELSQYLSVFRPDAAITTTPRTVYVLIPGGESESVVRLVNGALTAIHVAFKDQIRAAIAHTSTQPADLPNMRRELDDILRITTVNSALPAVAKLDDVHARVLLAHVADELMREPGLKHPGIEAMLAYDIENKTNYADSITAWLDAVGDIALAAESLFIHANTLRYRLRRVKDLFNITLDNPDDRLAVWMQLRLVAEKR
ncbi:unannotated protein [freshwater metagenome]|uniref:Unannotated protein n=1 Tax=freshwater metagenome TaxID=449393 RepID=A0A6J6VM94_9ZZZZ|nr:hypothetical protein [Actinomycetota bacterium]MSZ01649.1 hypothetical protein [Actinomycetota bacterium]